MTTEFEHIPSAEIDTTVARPGLRHIAAFLEADEPSDLQREKCKIGIQGNKLAVEKMRAESAQSVAAGKAVETVGVQREAARRKVEKLLGLAPATQKAIEPATA